MKKHLTLIAIFLLISSHLYSQKIIFSGEVRHSDGVGLDYFNIELLTLTPDTTVVFGQTYLTSRFSISEDFDNIVLMRVSSMGFQTEYIELKRPQNSSSIDVGVIQMKPSAYNLAELVVTGKKPTVKMKDGIINVRVQNSMLSHTGNIVDMLKCTPGIITSGEKSFTVLGRREAPLIMVNNREIKDISELESLRSVDVESIEIDKNPSSKYAASIKSIIHIRTKKQLKDIISTQVANDLQIKRRVSDNPSMRFAIKKGVMSTLVSYNYGYNDDKLYESSYKNIYNSDYILSNESDYTSRSKLNSHTLLAGTDLSFDKNKFGIQYIYRGSDRRASQNSENSLSKRDDLIMKEILDKSFLDRTLHNVSFNYAYERNKNSSLYVIADFAKVKNEKRNAILEKNLTKPSTTNIDVFSRSKYQVYSGKINYDFIIGSAYRIDVGGQFSYVDSDTKLRFNKKTTSLSENREITKQKDGTLAGYLNVRKSWGKLSGYLGFRYEYADSRVNVSSSDTVQELKKYYSDIFPSLMLAYGVSDDLNFVFNASRRVSRPSFGELDPSIYYEDSLNYVTGNPLIEPTFINELGLGAELWSSLSLNMRYSYFQNQRVQTVIADEKNPDLTKMMPINLKKFESFEFDVMYSYSHKKFDTSFSVGLVLPKAKVAYMNKMKKINKLSWNVNVDLNLALNDQFSLYSNFTYYSPEESLLTYSYSTNNLTVGITGIFLKKRLTVDLSGFDLLNGSNWNNWDEKYMNIATGTRGDYDSRGVSLKVAYSFDVNKITLKSKSSNRDVLDRTY